MILENISSTFLLDQRKDRNKKKISSKQILEIEIFGEISTTKKTEKVRNGEERMWGNLINRKNLEEKEH